MKLNPIILLISAIIGFLIDTVGSILTVFTVYKLIGVILFGSGSIILIVSTLIFLKNRGKQK